MASQGNLWWTADDLRTMRFGLASALMYDGYYSCTNAGAYTAAWWMDEFSVDLFTGESVMPQSASDTEHLAYVGWLGQPQATAFNVSDTSQSLWTVLQAGMGNDAHQSVWRRDFDNGIVIVNPTSTTQSVDLGGSFARIQGTVDGVTNDGAVVANINLPSESGLLLLR